MGRPLTQRELYQTHEVKAAREEKEKEIENGSIGYAKRRYSICKQCPEFNNIVKVCTECYCFMPGKVHIKQVQCPIGKWGIEE